MTIDIPHKLGTHADYLKEHQETVQKAKGRFGARYEHHMVAGKNPITQDHINPMMVAPKQCEIHPEHSQWNPHHYAGNPDRVKWAGHHDKTSANRKKKTDVGMQFNALYNGGSYKEFVNNKGL